MSAQSRLARAFAREPSASSSTSNVHFCCAARCTVASSCGATRALRSSGVAFDTADDFSSCVAFDISSVGAVHCDEVPAVEGGASP